MPRDVTITFDDGSTAQYKAVPDAATPEQVIARAGQDYPDRGVKAVDGGRGPGIGEAGKVLDKGFRGGLTALPGLIGDSALAVMRNAPSTMRQNPGAIGPAGGPMALAQMIQDKFVGREQPTDPIQATKFGDVTNALQTAGGALPTLSKPDTSAGKAIGNVLESIVSTFAGGGAGTVGQKFALGTGSGVGGEAGARLTNDSPIGRLVGSLLGGGGVAAYQALRPNAEELIQQSTGQMRNSDWRKAEVLDKLMNALGLPNLKSQLLGPRSTLDDVVAGASADPSVRPKVISAMSTAPAKAQSVATQALDSSLPVNIGGKQQALDDIQEVASKAIGARKDAANASFARAMPKEDLAYTQDQVKTLYDNLVTLAKSSKYGETSPQGKAMLRFANDLIESRAPGAAEALHPVVAARVQAAGEALPVGPEQLTFVTNAHKINNLIKGDNLRALKEEGFAGLPDKDIRRLVQAATPEFDAARAAKSNVMENLVNPAKKSLLGQIADMGGGPKPDKVTANARAINLVFNDGPKGQQIEQLADQIGADKVALMLREHLKKTMEQKSIWGADTGRIETQLQGPSRLVDAVAGQPWQRENIDAALGVWAKKMNQDPQDIKQGFYRLMDAMETYKDVKLAGGVSPNQAQAVASKNIVGAAAEPFGTTRRYFGAKATSKTYSQIADLVTSPDGLARLKEIGTAKSPERVRAIVQSMLPQVDDLSPGGQNRTE